MIRSALGQGDLGTTTGEPDVIHAPAAQRALWQGMATMARLLRPTLGPLSRTVAIAPLLESRPPEIIDNGATIARRTLQLPDPFIDMGSQIVRHLTSQVLERAGDGTATAAILAYELVRLAGPPLASGIDPRAIVRGLERGLAAVTAQLERQATEISLPAEIGRVVAAAVQPPALAAMIGEIVDSVGPDGAVLVEETHALDTTYDYIDGVRWNEGYLSSLFVDDGEPAVRLSEPRILLTDYPLETAAQLLPAVEACVQGGHRQLMVVAPRIHDSALALLIVNRQQGVLDRVVVVRAPGLGAQRGAILEDIATVTGGRCVRQERGDSLAVMGIADLGQARQAWATRFNFGILGGTGSKAAIRERIAHAKAELRTAGDAYTRDKIRERIGKLSGQSAVVRVGGPDPASRAERKAAVEAAARRGQLALRHGVVTGGGGAFVSCLSTLSTLRCEDPTEAVGVRILARALTEPMRAIVENAGLEPGPIIDESQRRGPEWAYDVVRRDWVDALESGLVDPLAVTLAVLETSVSAAKMVLTTEVLVRSKRPEVVLTP